jgi:hypothetical protein
LPHFWLFAAVTPDHATMFAVWKSANVMQSLNSANTRCAASDTVSSLGGVVGGVEGGSSSTGGSTVSPSSCVQPENNNTSSGAMAFMMYTCCNG